MVSYIVLEAHFLQKELLNNEQGRSFMGVANFSYCCSHYLPVRLCLKGGSNENFPFHLDIVH